MNVVMLSGVGGSTNWLPLILPLVVIVIVLKGGEWLIRALKKKRLERENELITRITSSFKDAGNTDIKTDQ